MNCLPHGGLAAVVQELDEITLNGPPRSDGKMGRCRCGIDGLHRRSEGLSSNVPTSIPPDTVLALYRIVQEGLRNIVKHSRALSAPVALTANRAEISLASRVCDEGF